MVYIAAHPTHGTEVSVRDAAELAEVRWVSPDEADELMAGMIYPPVRAHLRALPGARCRAELTPVRGRRHPDPLAE